MPTWRRPTLLSARGSIKEQGGQPCILSSSAHLKQFENDLKTFLPLNAFKGRQNCPEAFWLPRGLKI